MRFVIAAILIANIGCVTSPTEPERATRTVTLRYGETVTVADTRVSFTEIVDSRCPKEVACVWEGDAAVRLESRGEHVILHTNRSAGATEGTLAGLTITLVEVRPERVAQVETKKTDYVATLRISS